MTASSSGLNINAKEWRSNFPGVKTGKIICQFFAMGGCRHGIDCPFSHELTQEAPEGVDSSAGFFISGRVANLGNGSQSTTQPETKRLEPETAFSGPNNDSQRSSDAYCPPPAPAEVVFSNTAYIQSHVTHGAHGTFQIPGPNYENQSHHETEGTIDSRSTASGHQFFQHGHQIQQQSMYTPSLGHNQTENFYQVYAQNQGSAANHAPVAMLFNQNNKFSLPTSQVSAPEVGYSPTYPPQSHTPTVVDQSRYVGPPHNHQLPLAGVPPSHYIENSTASIQSTLYYHAESGSYIVRQPSQLQLTRPASYPSLSAHAHPQPQPQLQPQPQQQYYVTTSAVHVSKHSGTPTTYSSVQGSYPQAAQHHAAPSFGQLTHQVHSVQSAGVSPTLHQPNYHTPGFSSPSYQHPTVQVGAPPGGHSAHSAFFNNNNEAIRQSYQAPLGQSHYLGADQFAPHAVVHDSRRTSGSSLRDEYGTASSGGSSPIPTHGTSIEMLTLVRGPPPVVPKSIDDDGDDDCAASNAPARGRSGKMMMAPTPLS
jgi:hypothetical protein